MKRLTTLSDLSAAEIRDILDLADAFREETPGDALKNRVLGMLFMNPSIRTLASFQSAMTRLGGSSFVITPGAGSWKLESRDGVVMDGDAAEHIRDALPALAGYADALGVRVFGGPENISDRFTDLAFEKIEQLCPKPLINLESAVAHPCQALADWRTLDDAKVASDATFVLSWAKHPKSLPLAVPASAATMAALRGMNLVVLRPGTHALPGPLADKIESLAQTAGGSYRETSNHREALNGASVVYAKSWGPTSDVQMPIDENRWTVDVTWFSRDDDSCRFMHCLPVRRGVVVTDEVIESERSLVQRQAQNRLWVQMAVLYRMMSQPVEQPQQTAAEMAAGLI